MTNIQENYTWPPRHHAYSIYASNAPIMFRYSSVGSAAAAEEVLIEVQHCHFSAS